MAETLESAAGAVPAPAAQGEAEEGEAEAATCAICCDDMEDEGAVSKPKSCDHPFHYACLRAWVTNGTNDRCPFCRVRVTEIWNPASQNFERVARKSESPGAAFGAQDYVAEDPFAHVSCFVCGSSDNDATLMLCGDERSGCEIAAHTGCLAMDSMPGGNWVCPKCAGPPLPLTVTRDWVSRLVGYVAEGAQLDDPRQGAVEARRERLPRVLLHLQHLRARGLHYALRVDLLQALGRWVRPGTAAAEESMRFAILSQLKEIFNHVDFRLAKQSKIGAALVRCMNAPDESGRNRRIEDGMLARIQHLATQAMTQRPRLPEVLVQHIRALSMSRQGAHNASRVKRSYHLASSSNREIDQTQASLPSTLRTVRSDEHAARMAKRSLVYGSDTTTSSPSEKRARRREDDSKVPSSGPPVIRGESASSRARLIHTAISAVLRGVADREKVIPDDADSTRQKRALDSALQEFMKDGSHRDAIQAAIASRTPVFDIDAEKDPDTFVASLLCMSTSLVHSTAKRFIQFALFD